MSWLNPPPRGPISLPYNSNQRASDNLTPLGASSPDRYPIPANAMKESPNATYTPPSLPEYLKNVCDFKPIFGAPKDDEVKGIHVVLRMAHSTTHTPGIFDPELSMNLAQHLFEAQLARHRERYPFGLFLQRAPKPSHASTPVDLTTDVSDEEATDAPQGTSRGDSVESREPGVQVESIDRRTVGQITVEGPDRLLEELVDTMKGIKQVLIGAHHSHARSSRRSRFLGTGPEVGEFELMNDKGELPTLKHRIQHMWVLVSTKGLPMIGKKGYYFQYDSALTADQLAQYLQFYNIGHDLVDIGDKPTIRKGQRAKAVELLSNYLN